MTRSHWFSFGRQRRVRKLSAASPGKPRTTVPMSAGPLGFPASSHTAAAIVGPGSPQ